MTSRSFLLFAFLDVPVFKGSPPFREQYRNPSRRKTSSWSYIVNFDKKKDIRLFSFSADSLSDSVGAVKAKNN